jgi:hypothetical protein
MGSQIKGFRSGSGAVIPYGAKLEPFKKNNASDADFFGKVLRVLDSQMEHSILMKLADSPDGLHESREVSDLLHSLIFWIRWSIAVSTSTDLLEVAVRKNLGEWALRYMPFVSLGDFVRRDWAEDLDKISDAYYKGFIDDSQRAELMAWLNLPKPGQSRAELEMEMGVAPGQTGAQKDANGNPIMPNKNRADQQTGNKNRNATRKEKTNNGTNRKRSANSSDGLGSLNFLGHHRGRSSGFTRNIFTGRQ